MCAREEPCHFLTLCFTCFRIPIIVLSDSCVTCALTNLVMGKWVYCDLG